MVGGVVDVVVADVVVGKVGDVTDGPADVVGDVVDVVVADVAVGKVGVVADGPADGGVVPVGILTWSRGSDQTSENGWLIKSVSNRL